MKKYLYPVVIKKIPTYLKYWLMYSSKKISLLIQSLPITLENTIKDLKIIINKIYGNTEQATRSGINKFNKNNLTTTNCTLSYSNGIYTATKTGSSPRINSNISLPAGSYTLNSISSIATIIFYNGDTIVRSLGTSHSYYNFTLDTDVDNVRFWFNSDTYDFDFDSLMIVSGTYTSSTMPDYEEYGAMPSPDYPSPVNNVTGDVEITISNEDNTEEQNYPISLGSLELCKIGDYQDYIYKENGNWYKYGAIGKTIFDGSQDEGWTLLYSTYLVSGIIQDVVGDNNILNSKCNIATVKTLDDLNSSDTNKYALQVSSQSSSIITRFWFSFDEFSTAREFKTYLNSNPMSVYYALATPTITQITDTTLINQLNALEQAYTYEDVTNISSNQNIYLDIDYIKRG